MKKVLAVLLVGVSPLLALAVDTDVSSIDAIFNSVKSVLGALIPIFISLAVVYFIWEVFQYTIAGDEDKKSAAKKGMIWGIIGLFIMISIWGLVGILTTSFGLSGTGAPPNLDQLIP